MKANTLYLITALASALVCSCKGSTTWTEQETALVSGEGVMKVYTTADVQDSLLLRLPSTELSADDIASPLYETLAQRMLETVNSPEQNGVGIAGPQLGVLRRVVAVMRYDKEGRPFEVFPNIRIDEYIGQTQPGPEGCLSVPDMHGMVQRHQEIKISYTSPKTLCDTTEYINGYTAVIFQHECDHLDGILYIDKME